MVLDEPGFHVDVDKVDEAARGIHDSVQDQDNFALCAACVVTRNSTDIPASTMRSWTCASEGAMASIR